MSGKVAALSFGILVMIFLVQWIAHPLLMREWSENHRWVSGSVYLG